MRSRSYLHVVLIAAFATLATATAATAQARVRFDLAQQPLEESLRAVGKTTNINILIDRKLVAGLRAPALQAELDADQAITELLEGTGLTHEFVNENTVVLMTAADKSAKQPTPAAAPVSEGRVGAHSGKEISRADGSSETKGAEKKSFWDRFRLAQVDQGKTASDGAVERADAVSASDDRVSLEEIVVTAQKREERLIDTPQSVSVLTADALARLGAIQFRDFANTVPGLSFTTIGAGYTQISLRGVTSGFDIGSTVGTYIDDVPFGSSSAFAQGGQVSLDVGLFDIDRIEVLRGPQGTLYGASTMGGLIKYVTRQPNVERFDVDVQSGISGTRDGGTSYNTAVAVNAPLAGNAAVRVSGFYSRDGGYIDNLVLDQSDVNSSDIYGGRVDLLLTPTSALTVRIGAFLQNIDREGEATTDYTFSGVPRFDGLEQSRLVVEPFAQRFRLVSGTVAYDFGPATLTSISSYQTARTHIVHDLSASYVPALEFFGLGTYSAVGFPVDYYTRKLTQEVRLASNGARQLEWLAGGFYTREASENEQVFELFDPAGEPARNAVYTLSSPTRYEESAAFADLTYHLTRQFDVSGGVRYAQNKQVFTQKGSGALGITTPTRRSSEEVFTYLANARYRFGDHATGYLRYATGYRPGGPNFVANDPATGLPAGPATFEADRLRSYEAGFKTQTADRRFELDVAAYHIDWKDLHISTVRGGFGVIANAFGGAVIRGSELTLTVRPLSGLAMTGAFAYQDAHMAEADPDLAAAKGERLPNVPRFTAALNADYELPVGGLRPTIGATLRHVTDRRTSFDASTGFPQYRLPAYTTLDLRTGLELGQVALQLYVRNLFDKDGQLSAFTAYSSPVGAQVAILQPRTFGINATTRF